MNINNRVKGLIAGMSILSTVMYGGIIFANASPNVINSLHPLENELKISEVNSIEHVLTEMDTKINEDVKVALIGDLTGEEYIQNMLATSIHEKIYPVEKKFMSQNNIGGYVSLPSRGIEVSMNAEEAYKIAEESYKEEDDVVIIPKQETQSQINDKDIAEETTNIAEKAAAKPASSKPSPSTPAAVGGGKVIKAYPHKTFKSYMSWKALSPSSPQGKLSAKATKDPSTAIMKYNGRYLVALGYAYADEIGEPIDIVMESGQVIPAIVGDWKAKKDTDKYNSTCQTNGSIMEFIVSSNKEANIATNRSGSYDSIFPGKVKEFRK